MTRECSCSTNNAGGAPRQAQVFTVGRRSGERGAPPAPWSRQGAPGARICKKSALGVLLMEDGRSQRMPCPLTHDLCTVTATDAESSVGGFALTSEQAGRREAATKRRTCPARTKIYNAVPATAPSLYGGTWYRGHLLLAHS